MHREKKIFIVEDETIIALTLESTLQSMGFEVMGNVSSGEECLEYLKSYQPDLILMDIRLNGKLNGIETAKEIKNNYDIPVIFLTAYSTKELIEQAKEVNPYGYIVKPFREKDIQISVTLSLNKHTYEKKLVASENKYRTLIETINEGIFQINLIDYSVQYINQTLCDMLELSYEEIANKPTEILYFLKDHQDYFLELCERRKAGIAEKYELRIITKSKQEKYFAISGTPVKNEEGNIYAALSVWHDITEKKEREIQLKKFFSTIEQSEELIMVTDKFGMIEYSNPKFNEVTGYTKEELSRKTPNILFSGSHDNTFYKEVWEVISHGKSFAGEFINRKKNGEIYYEEKIITPLLNEAGEITNFISSGRDVTEKRRLEKEMESYRVAQAQNEERQARIRSNSLIQGQEEERQRISRDLHDGIGQILTAAKINLEKLDFNELAETSKFKDLVKVYDLVNETINEVRRISYDLSPATLHDYGLLSAVKTIISKINGATNKFNIELSTNLKSERFKNDIEINVYRIIQEAINNSIKHANCTLIEVYIFQVEGMLHVSVSDNGTGWVPENNSENKKDKLSSGIRNIKERGYLMGSEVNIVSIPDKGHSIDFKIKIKETKQ